MNENEIAGLAEEVNSFVQESIAEIGDRVDARLAEAAELANQIKAESEALKGEGESRKKEIDDLADALDLLTSQIEEIEAIKAEDGVDGKDGIHGKDGVDGKDGIDGADGEKGDKGDAGAVGEKGVDGKDGSDGIDGVNGAKGEAGPQGADGVDGSDGAGIDAPIYKSGVYREGSVVQANFGQYFKALQDTAEGVDHESWERVGLNGFRMTGAFDEAKSYISGDLFIKDFGLFLSDGEESRLVAGRGPSGKRGEKGLAGKDGSPGADGVDGDTFDVMEVSGTNLVVVVRSGDGSVSTKSVDLSPVFDVASDITKSIEANTESNVKAQFEAHAKGLLEYISEHISDQEAIPLRFFRGLYNTYNTYERGDTVVFGNALYVTKEGTSAVPNSIFEKDNPWSLVIGASGGEGGDADLSGYVKRPSAVLRNGKWLLYRETTDGKREWTPATTDLIETNGQLMFRDIKGRFAPTPEELDELTNQLKVNRFIWEKIQELDLKAGGVAISDTPPDKPDNGMFWFDNSEDVMQLFIWHKDSDAWIPVAPPTTLEGRVSSGESTQKAIIAQIQESLVEQEKLQDKVRALEGVVGEHSLTFTTTNSNPRHGEFNLKNSGMEIVNSISLAQYISMTDTDSAGNPINLDRITEGDVLRFSSVDGQVAELKITDGTNGVFTFNKVSGDLDRLSEAPYQFILLSSFDPAGLATIDYVDAQDDKKLDKTGGTIDGSLVFQRGDKTSPQFRITPNGGTNYATSIYAMNNAQLRLRSSHTDGEVDHVGSHVIIQANDGNPVTSIYHLSHPYSDDMPVSKGYLNSAIHAPPNTGDAPTTTKLWKYCEGKSKWELRNNEFSIDFKGGDKDEIEIYLYGYINGKWWVPASTINYSHVIGEVYCTISDYQGAAAIGFKGLKWWFMQKGQNSEGADKYHNCLAGNYYKHAYPESYKLKDQHYYSLNFPSPFPLVKFPQDIHTGEAGAFGVEPEVEGVPPDAVDMGEVMP